MAIKFNRSQTFATNGTVTAAGLHNLIDGTDIYQALITDQTDLSSVATDDKLLIADASLTAGDAPRSTTVQNLFDDALTGGTYTNANLSGVFTFGTATGNRTVSTSATITTGTIPNLTSSTANITLGTIPTLTAGTTTSTAANITNGTIQTLTASTATITAGTYSGAINSTLGTIATLNSTTGTITGLRSTTGTVATLNSTTGTITNLSTTLAGDFTISQGTATIGIATITPAKLSQPITSGVQTASTTGTAIDFTGIPSWAKRITVMLNGVSVSGTSPIEIRIGTASGIEATGYKSCAGWGGEVNRYNPSTTGFSTLAISGFAAADLLHGSMIISTLGSNTWVEQCGFYLDGASSNIQQNGGGSKTLTGGVLDRVRVTTVGGSNTFDAGTINIIYEG